MMPKFANSMPLFLLVMCSIATIGSNKNETNNYKSNNLSPKELHGNDHLNNNKANIVKNIFNKKKLSGKTCTQNQNPSERNITRDAAATKPDTLKLLREKRDTATTNTNFELEQSEVARQNQITQQIFANYLERRLFPNRSINQKIPTIEDILPKPVINTRGFKRGTNSSSNRGTQRKRKYGRGRAVGDNKKKQTAEKLSGNADLVEEDFDVDGQESLQSVESEQHDHYYDNLFQRDPSENEIESDCPNCVDETQYANKWTMPLLKLGEKRYYLGIFFKANWFKAAQYCRYHGMHLASISSQEENDRLEKYIRDFGLGHEHFWISGTDLADEGTFFWMANGRPITFTNWNAGEPNNFRYENGEEENCLELWNRDGKGLKWNDSPCSFETYFVCEIQPN